MAYDCCLEQETKYITAELQCNRQGMAGCGGECVASVEALASGERSSPSARITQHYEKSSRRKVRGFYTSTAALVGEVGALLV